MVQINITLEAVLIFISFCIVAGFAFLYFFNQKKNNSKSLVNQENSINKELLEINFENNIVPISKPKGFEEIDSSKIDKGVLNSIKEIAEASQNIKGRKSYFELVLNNKEKGLLKHGNWDGVLSTSLFHYKLIRCEHS